MYKSAYNTPSNNRRTRIERFAVLMNANARGVSQKTLADFSRLIPARDLFCSTSIEESEAMIQTMIERGYDAIFACGGDGSITHLVNALRSELPDARRQPMVGVLRMGTGNALASHLGAGPALHDLELLARGAQVERQRLSLIESEGQLFPFAGCGLDAALLNDFVNLKARATGPMKPVMSGLQGYFAAALSKTVPTLLIQKRRKVFAINEGPAAYRIDAEGNILDVYEPGQVMYQGEIDMSSVGAIPYYGFNMKMFPNATLRPGFFQLRLARINPIMALVHLNKVWNGTIGEKQGVHDFVAQRVRLEFDGDVPFQTAGDARGTRREVTFRSATRSFEFARPTEVIREPFIPSPSSRQGLFNQLGLAAA